MTDTAPDTPLSPEPPPAEAASPAPLSPAPRRLSGSPVAWAMALALAAVVGTLLFLGGYLAAGTSSSSSCVASKAFEALCQAYNRLKSEYVDQLDDQALAGGAIQGMFEYGVKDPFSGYMSPEDYQRAVGDLSGEFSGIGAEMGVKNLQDPKNLDVCTTFSDQCALVVVAPLEDSPAKAAGLLAGDRVVKIDGTSVNGLSLEDAVKQVRGEAGTKVTLSLVRDGKSLEMTITRAKITMKEVTSRMLPDHIGYIALHGFSSASPGQFHDALGKLLDDGATSIVFDLRDNPGGYIDAANNIASEFIKDGLVFTQESEADGVTRWQATGKGLATDPKIAVAVLVNNGSASASEIVSAALKERGRATIIGQHTYGKNTVQLWSTLENGGGVRITISRWFTPDHHSVAPNGVQPNITVNVPDGTPPERDLFLERAVAFLENRSTGLSPGSSPQPSGGGESSFLAPVLSLLSPTSYDVSGLRVAPV